MATPSQQVEWLSLVETSGPFLTLPVLEQAFPQGLESIETPRRQLLRAAYYEWRDAVDEDDDLLPQLHDAWVNLVLTDLLEFDAESATPGTAWASELPSISSPDDTARFCPSWIIHSPGSTQPRLFISVVRPDAPLDSAANPDGWIANEIERMTLLCRAHGVRVGIVTNGESWVLVNAPIESPSGQATWHSRYWFQEPATLKAFQSLLGVRRWFGPPAEALDALLDESLKYQEEVTDTLGEQVRRATEVLIQALDKADEDRNRELLHEVPPAQLYEASLTVMMRLVFILCAEERGLLLLGDLAYDQNLAVSTLRGQLAEDANQFGEEVLERRYDAWARLLSAFRAVYAGIEHEDLRLPAMGGSLFDPDRYPFLEGRAAGSSWLDTASQPLPIDNRTVLLLLTSLQVLEHPRGALALSYRALDVEQIGHVYEGLLDHTVVRVSDTTLGLKGSAKNRYPTFDLTSLESLRFDGVEGLIDRLAAASGRTPSSIRNELTRLIPDPVRASVLSAVNGDQALADRIAPFANLVRSDAWGAAIIYRARSFMVTPGVDRRETGTHYTPRSLTEQIVNAALEPIANLGPAEGRPRDEWVLKSAEALLDIRVCDPAMGSGAFLVQACRYLGDRLVEAWATAEAEGRFVTVDGEVVEELGTDDPLPSPPDERVNVARRLVAQRCLYGVDINPLAAELAKLSIWLVTLAQGKPFGFLDHNLRAGNSLVGVHRAEQLVQMRLNPIAGSRQTGLLDDVVEGAVRRAVEVRQHLRGVRELDISDVQARAALDAQAREIVSAVEVVADALVSEAMRLGPRSRSLNSVCDSLALQAAAAFDAEGRDEAIRLHQSLAGSGTETPGRERYGKPFHWALEFPEVFALGGFDAIVSNPPFLAHKRIASAIGEDQREYVSAFLSPKKRGKCDLVVFFMLRFAQLVKPQTGMIGMIASKAIAEGVSREVGLVQLTERTSEAFTIMSAIRSKAWPGKAQTLYSAVWLARSWSGAVRHDGAVVTSINTHLDPDEDDAALPIRLKANSGICHQGVIPQGKGFVISSERRDSLIAQDPSSAEVLAPYLDGHDVTDTPDHTPRRFVIDFGEMSADEASRYSAVWDLAEKTILPERVNKDAAKYPRMVNEWWKHWNPRLEMRRRLADLSEYLTIVGHTKWLVPVRVPAHYLPSSALRVFCSESFGLQAILSSSIHAEWAIKWGSTLGESFRYNPSVVFGSLPLPQVTSELEDVGKSLQDTRTEIMMRRQLGLTALYNLIHDPACSGDSDVQRLRTIHTMVDEATAAAFGWGDLRLDVGFHDYRGMTRWTVGPQARDELLVLLREENLRASLMHPAAKAN